MGFINTGRRFYLAGGTSVVVSPTIRDKGKLEIESSPKGAKIVVNEHNHGNAPQQLSGLTPGNYEVIASLDGYRSEQKLIRVDNGQTAFVTFYLDQDVQVDGRLFVTANPSDVTIDIIGFGQDYVDGLSLPAGRYEVQISMDGYETKSYSVVVEGGKASNLEVVLSKKVQGSKFNNRLDMQFVYITPGTFTMGSPKNAPGRDGDEKQHRVTLSKGFYIQTTEVTQRQWKSVMGSNPSHFSDCGDYCPVENVSWSEVQLFIKNLNQSDGKKIYRLPTEAEWEYACRSGGRDELYSGGHTIDRVAWYYPNSQGKTQPVGMKTPNRLGLYDMSGNVWEWCQDIYSNYNSGLSYDPVGTLSGGYRVLRGGSWSKFGVYTSEILRNTHQFNIYCRCSDRYKLDPGYRRDCIGFRLAAD